MAKFFKWLFISVTGFLILFFGVTALLSPRYSVERSAKVGVPVDSVFNVVADLQTWEHWNPWLLVDSTMQNKINIKKSIVGSTWEWKSEHLGTGRLQIRDIARPNKIYAEMTFFMPKKSTIDEYWTFEPVSKDSTEITWRHDGDLSYPVGRLMGLFSNNLLGPTFDEGLRNLKNYLENDGSMKK